MREYELREALKARIEEALKDLQLESADHKPKKPHVVKGWYLPEEQNAFSGDDVQEIAPFVIVRTTKGQENARDQFQVETEVIVQIFNDSSDFTGDTECLLAMNRIRDNILDKPTLDKMFIYDGGFKWQLNPEQPFPNWEIQITMNWLIPNPQRSDYNEFT